MLRRFFKRKIAFGPWFKTPLRMLAAMKGLRGGPLDIFGRSQHRKMERGLIAWYRDLIARTLDCLTEENLPRALEIAALPDRIRGYESIKENNIAQARQRAGELLGQMSTEPAAVR